MLGMLSLLRSTSTTASELLRAADEAASAALCRPEAERSAVCANPVVSPETTRIPAPLSLPLFNSSTKPSSRTADVDLLSSIKISANEPPDFIAEERTSSRRSDGTICISVKNFPFQVVYENSI